MSTGQSAWACARWLVRLLEGALRCLRREPPRFWRLSPPMLARQAIYDRHTGRVFSLAVRDAIDLNLLGLIFDRNEYGFERLARANELGALHDAIVARKHRPLIVDCGAHGGFATRFFAETYPQSRIVALEPDEANLALARRNNAEARISLRRAAVGNADGAGRLSVGHNSLAHRIASDPNGEIPILSIDSILAEERELGAEPFIVKIVIEGFEEKLFAANTGWIDAFPVLIVELHDDMLPGTANSHTFLQEMARRDRDFVYFGKNIFSISNTAR